MLTHAQLEKLIAAATADAARLLPFRETTQAIEVRLTEDMAALLGANTGTRRIVPFLAVVTETVASKLELDEQALQASKVRDSKQLVAWLGDAAWGLTERDLYRAVSRDGVAYILTRWIDSRPDYAVREAFDGTSGAFSATIAGQPAAVNCWKQDDTVYADVYYESQIETYQRVGDAQWRRRADAPGDAWPLDWTDDAGQPLGIALVAYSIGRSDVADALQLGRDLNEAVIDLVATSRTQGWPQRFLRGQKNAAVLLNDAGQPIISPLTGRPFPRTVKALPGSIMPLQGEAELGQLDAAVPRTEALDALLELLSLITTVPTHYFRGEWPSGVALIQAESRLNHKVEGHQARLSQAVVAMLQLSMRLANTFGGATFDPAQTLDIPWHAPQIETEEIRRERDQATTDQVTKLYSAKLMSIDTALRALHPDWDDAQIADEVAALDAARQAATPPVLALGQSADSTVTTPITS